MDFLVSSLSFSTLQTLSHPCLLDSKIAQKSDVNLTEVSMYLVTCFSLAAFRTVSFSLTFDSLVMVCESLILSYLEFVNFLDV